MEASGSNAILFWEVKIIMKCIVVCFVLVFNAGCEPKLDFSTPEKTIEIYYKGWKERRPELIESATWAPQEQRETMKKYGSGYNFGPPEAPNLLEYKILSKRTVTQDDIEKFVKNNEPGYVKKNGEWVEDDELPYWLAVGDLEFIVNVEYSNTPPLKVSLKLRLIEKEWKIVGSCYIPDENYPDTEPPPDI